MSACMSTSKLNNTPLRHAKEVNAKESPILLKSAEGSTQESEGAVADQSRQLLNASTEEIIMQLQSRYQEAQAFLQTSMTG